MQVYLLLLLIVVTDLCMLSFLVIVLSMSNIFGHHLRPLQQAQKTMNMFLVKLSKFVLFCCNILLEHLKPTVMAVK